MMTYRDYLIEWCAEDLELIIEHNHLANQIEWCSDLDNEGLTPDFNDTIFLLKSIDKPLKVMIRCRPGHFEYTPSELAEMIEDALCFKEVGVRHFVFGAIKNRRLNLESISAFCEAVFPAKVTIHKAIDESQNRIEDVKTLKTIPNIEAILSSGGKTTAIEGAEGIKAMQEAAGKGINIIAAGKITHENIEDVHKAIGVKVYHGRRIIKG